ncbi:hypothetical protein [Pedobacter heparinus]|uniref:hypothetical protein n=1 Tax=Pedobacter heparinus TaxID=984 RepID=UPI00292F5DC5|nr:hypothetical protein [Pedobacter heparinus]
MGSEKSKYRKIPIYDPEIHIPALEKALAAQPDKLLLEKFREAGADDAYLLYELAAEFLPLTHQETLALLKGFVVWQINDCYVIAEAMEEEIAAFTDLLMERYKELRNAGQLEEAVGVLGAIILAVEPQYGNTADEGITFHGILEEAFEELDDIVAGLGKAEPLIQQLHAVTLHQQIRDYFEQLNPDEQFFEDRWELLIAKLRALIKY